VSLEAQGQLRFETAEALLATCLFDGILDEHVFKKRVGELIRKAKASSANGQARVFGEMVNLTWPQDALTTQRIEELWNEVIKLHSVPLLCAYALGGTRPGVLAGSLLACHSEALV
jgi:hypothetical protein